MTARSVNISWNEIECIERNGMITNYTVEFSSLGGSVVPGVLMVNERRFTASGLTPFTNYTFQVAGVNSYGIGPFSNIIIETAEDSMFDFTMHYSNRVIYYFPCIAPGVVSVLGSNPRFTSMDITWAPPDSPNGVILRYEVTYTINNSSPITNSTELNTAFTIPSLTPGTRVSVSVSAYTSAGQGEVANLTDLMTSAICEFILNMAD